MISPSKVDTSITEVFNGTLPANYGFDYAFGDVGDHTCGVVTIGKPSSIQYLSLTADFGSGDVTSGSYQLGLGGHYTTCIDYNATSADIKLALLSLSNVNDVDVIQYAMSQDSSFPFEYKIIFKGEYQYGDWPILSVLEDYPGVHQCVTFRGGSAHNVIVIPIKEEASCSKGNGETQVILAEANSPLGGSFDLFHGSESIKSISVDSNAEDMKVNNLTNQYI